MKYSAKRSDKIISVSGNKHEVFINHGKPNYPCFSMWYKVNISYEDDEIKRKIENFNNLRTKKWIYPLDDGWYIKGEECF